MKNIEIKFNKEQKKAVDHLHGPMLTVAGAGTGKTSVLIGRLANLALNHKIALDEILLLTFTEKAAGEMEERADRLLPYGYFDSQIHTFHGFSEKVLREFALEIGINPDFKLLNTTEQWILFVKNINSFNLKYYRPLGSPNKFVSEILKHFSRLKDEDISPQKYLKYVKSLKKKLKKNQEDEVEKIEVERLYELAETYQKYNQLLLDNNYLDFGDLIMYSLKLFKERPNILSLWQKRCRFVMVDEFQDTNWAQYELVKILSKDNDNLLVVGDDDQAIYKFRGASLANIMQFKEDYPQAKEVLLTDNYRSFQEILDKAYLVIKNNNPYRLEEKLGINKKIISQIPQKPGQKLVFKNLANSLEEINTVAKKIKELYKKGAAFSEFAILARSNQVAEDFSSQLKKQGIPNQFISLRGLYRKDIIVSSLAYLRALNDFHQANVLFSLFNLPKFNIKYAQIVEINRFAKRKNLSLFEALENIREVTNLEKETIKKAEKLVNLLKKHGGLVKDKPSSEIFIEFIKDSGLIENLDYDRDQEQFSYLNQFYKKIKNFENNLKDAKLSDFLESLDLEMEAGDSGSLSLDFVDSETVKIMTVHGAKGLEFNYVFLVSLMERRFPSDNRKDKIEMPIELIKEKIDESKDRHIEEERRLFYVAMTRAKKLLHLSSWWGEGEPRERKVSRFVLETGLKSEKTKNKKTLNEKELIKDINKKDDIEIKNQELVLPSRFSFSQLTAFENCPLQYKFAFILKIPVPSDKASLIFGRLMHNVLYEFLLPLSQGGQADLFAKKPDFKEYINWARLKNIYQKRFISDGYNSKKEAEDYYNEGLNNLKLFLQQIKEQKPELLYLEKNFSFRLNNDIIKGTIDRIDKNLDGSLNVIDYKTGNSKEKLSYKDKKQLIIYQLFLESSLNLKVSNLSYYYLKDGTKQTFTASDDEKIKVETETIEQIKAIKKKEFPAKPSRLCQYCDFKEICPWRQI